jgi:hypothetical protein
LSQRNDLGRQQLVGHDDQRPVQRQRGQGHEIGQVGVESHHHVRDIVQPVLEILVRDSGERLGALPQQSLQGSLSRQAFFDDPAADAVRERRIAEHSAVRSENRGLLAADLVIDFLLQRQQVLRGPLPGRFVLSQLGGNLVILEPLAIRLQKDLVDAIGSSDRHAGRDWNSSTHGILW